MNTQAKTTKETLIAKVADKMKTEAAAACGICHACRFEQ